MNRRRFFQHSAAVAMMSRPAFARLQAIAEQSNDSTASFWNNIRRQFPLRNDRVYFNTAGLGPSPQTVLDGLQNETRSHDETGEAGHEIFDKARRRVAAWVGAAAEEIAFTRNATEGMNIIARGVPLRANDEVLTTFHEHPGGAIPWIVAARNAGATIRLIDLPKQPKDVVAEVERNLNAATRVFMMSHVPCTTGTIYPAADFCALLRERGIISVLDGAQAVGMTPVALRTIGCDFYTTSGHKWLLGPKESGFVYIANATQEFFKPSFVGAYSDVRYDLDEMALELRKTAQVSEYGTRNAATIRGLLAALDFFEAIGWQKTFDRQRELACLLIEDLQKLPRVELLTAPEAGAFGGIVTFRVKGLSGLQITQKLLEDFKIRARAITEHKLDACRISLHVFNAPEEVERLFDAVQEIAS
jgi:selenocysteine lyase/cysteine desulfurase